MKYNLHFPIAVYRFDIGNVEFNKYLETEILKMKSEDKGLQRTNIKGWHSTDNMSTKEEYKPLVEDLYKAQRMIYKEENYVSEPVLGNMWANVNPSGAFNMPHMHPNSLWSGVYYIKTPENCGSLKIEDPRFASLMSMPNRKEPWPAHCAREVSYEPVAGRLLMFPSYLMHRVEPNKSDDIRISVSFNFLQKGMYV